RELQIFGAAEPAQPVDAKAAYDAKVKTALSRLESYPLFGAFWYLLRNSIRNTADDHKKVVVFFVRFCCFLSFPRLTFLQWKQRYKSMLNISALMGGAFFFLPDAKEDLFLSSTRRTLAWAAPFCAGVGLWSMASY